MKESKLEIIRKYDLCDNCIGRLISDKKIDYEKIAKNLRKGKNLKKTDIINCYLCQGLLSEIEKFTKLILKELTKFDFDTFLIGTKIDEDILSKENKINKLLKNENINYLKNEINRELGLILEKKLDKVVNFERPDIMVILDTQFDNINFQIQSLFIYGRYKKYSRKIPQTKWYCKICKGKGCRDCNYKGTKYNKSVEELIAKDFLKETKSDLESFHGAGREDIDVKMLGTGRPFIIELKDPKKRKIDLKILEEKINSKNKKYIEISNLRFSNREEVVKIKNSKYKKVYEVTIKSEKALNIEKLKKVAQSLQGKTINQKTPCRVAHRRADLLRKKKIYSCQIKQLEGTISKLVVEAESGTYIKELINGDKGRTKPNISDLLNTPCVVKTLDVIEIKGE